MKYLLQDFTTGHTVESTTANGSEHLPTWFTMGPIAANSVKEDVAIKEHSRHVDPRSLSSLCPNQEEQNQGDSENSASPQPCTIGRYQGGTAHARPRA
jgi:hypothetical protein